VVHAQVSINPGNRRIGWHTDWGAGFPFREIGLPDNYQIRDACGVLGKLFGKGRQ
jgi:hypothetical protein